ncbi:MAG: trypsin-like peptidase domain-containing protein [Planctomycetales bacterium]|nr:trypsin-like peptidase domain-containing protein [Planctomycetales bacterium]
MDEFSPKNLPAAPQTPSPVEAPASFYANPQAMHPQTEVIYTQVMLAERGPQSEVLRVKLAWAKLLWLLVFLGALLAIAYVVPYVIEETNYAATRGKMRAEHEQAGEELQGDPLAQFSRNSQLVTRRVAPSVVHISAADFITSNASTRPFLNSSPYFPTPPPGQGSGVVVDSRGYIITNYHVIQRAQRILVRLSDGRKDMPAQLIGFDKESDIAVLRVTATGLIAAEWGDSEDLQVGSLVWAMGSPYGLDQTVTGGIVSAKHRAGKVGTPFQDFLQTDAAVNPGNSGGPLVNTTGKVVGINTAIVGDNYQGISFAIPSSVVRRIYDRLLAEGQVHRGFLGIQPLELSDEAARNAKLSPPRGVFVENVVIDSPAASVGLRQGDIILKWNEVPITSPAQMTTVISDTAIGSGAQLVIWRDGEEIPLEIKVGERPLTN